MISIFSTKNLKNDFTILLKISKSSEYIPNLIISSFDSTYDQFQMNTEILNFYLKKSLSYIFHIFKFNDKHFFVQKIKNDFTIMLNISKSSEYTKSHNKLIRLYL